MQIDDDTLRESALHAAVEDEAAGLSAADIILVPPGSYEAICQRVKKVRCFNGRMVAEFEFRLVGIGPYSGVVLPAYATLDAGRPRRASKLASWKRAIAIYTGGSPSRVTLRMFERFLYRVEVVTVEKDHRQRQLRPRDQYSKVNDVIEVIQGLADARESAR
jgi:hypothetical protein